MIQICYCITESPIPKGLEGILEPTISNHDRNVLRNLQSNLKHDRH